MLCSLVGQVLAVGVVHQGTVNKMIYYIQRIYKNDKVEVCLLFLVSPNASNSTRLVIKYSSLKNKNLLLL